MHQTPGTTPHRSGKTATIREHSMVQLTAVSTATRSTQHYSRRMAVPGLSRRCPLVDDPIGETALFGNAVWVLDATL